MNIGIYIYPDAEVLDYAGPFEVFSTAKRLSGADWQVLLIAQTLDPVMTRGGVTVLPHHAIDEHPALDLLIVAGGVHTAELDKTPVIDWIGRTARTCHWVASVCTGAFLLAEAGVLTDQVVTTHWEDIADLQARYPRLQVISDRRWTCNGNLFTSAGISAGIDMSLQLVSELASQSLAERTARQMDYHWQTPPDTSTRHDSCSF